MTARESESALLARCAMAAQGHAAVAQDQREANVFRLASMLMRSRSPLAASRLMQASEQYFSRHPEAQLPAEEVLHRGWVFSLPRLRDMLSPQLQGLT